jgi:hypothetical protein
MHLRQRFSLCTLSVPRFQPSRWSPFPIASTLIPSSTNQWTSQNRGKTWFRKLDVCLRRNNWSEPLQALRFLIEFTAMEVYQQWRSSDRFSDVTIQHLSITKGTFFKLCNVAKSPRNRWSVRMHGTNAVEAQVTHCWELIFPLLFPKRVEGLDKP